MILRLTLRERLLVRLGLLPAPVMDGFGSVLFGRSFALAVRRGVFEHLSEGSRPVEEIAAHAGLTPYALNLILEASTVAGYVHPDRKGYALTGAGRKWLLSTSPTSLASLIGYFETLYGRWETLEETLQRGAPQRPYYAAFSSEDWKLYVLAMRDLARYLLPYVIRKIRVPANARHLLDVGGSHGLYAMGLCRRASGLQATILDFPEALRWSRTIVEEATMLERVTFLPGDLRQTPFPGGRDLILLFNVVHGLTRDENREVVKRALEALRPGGKLYILDQCLETGNRSDLSRFLPLMVGLNLLNETGGGIYDRGEILDWCQAARTVRPVRLLLPGLTLVEAVR